MRGGGPTLDPALVPFLPRSQGPQFLNHEESPSAKQPVAAACTLSGAERLSPAVQSEVVTLNTAKGPLHQPGLSRDPVNIPFPEH